LLSDVELEGLRQELPPPPLPQGDYTPAVVAGSLVQTAGMTPRVDGVLRHVGRVGAGLTIAEGRAAAAIAAENALSAALSVVAPGTRLDRVVQLRVYVNSVPGFGEHGAVADGASARLRELLGERGRAARVAVGVASLPQSACVEVELSCALVCEE
jgi:enamine deaminase RidA (YjgF/YER057c/UK114 family)